MGRDDLTPENMALLEQIRSVSVWKQGSQRAPHKPLLLLMSLAAVQRGDERLTKYDDLHPRLAQLLTDYGPPRKSVHPEYPFWRLQNDGQFWLVPEREAAVELRGDRARSGDVPPAVLREIDARGGFTEGVYNALRGDPELVNEIVASILDEHFPPSFHESLLDSVGMPWVVRSGKPRKRSPEFRDEVVRIYEHRCAMCGFDGRLGGADLALEAAHIRWHAQGGPDEPRNGLLLCSIHHKALDRGAVGLTEDRRIMVSQHLYGGSRVDDLIIGLCGEAVRSPIDPAVSPGEEFMGWHRREVFREPSRPAT